METKKGIDRSIFGPSIIFALALSLPLVLFPQGGKKVVDVLFAFCTQKFGWLFLLFGLGSVIFLIWLAASRYGNIKLGAPEDKPEFSKISWLGMMFCAGIGIAIVNWAFVEPIYYITGPPLGLEKGSDTAREWAGMYGIFHWSITPWAIYALPSFAIAYCVHVRKKHFLRLSAAGEGVLGSAANGWFGKLIDIIVVFALIGGVGTSLGLAVPLVTTFVGYTFGLPDSFFLKIVILLIWTAIFSASVYRGLSKGIKILSDINVWLAFFLLIYVLLVGPTVWILSLWCNSFGLFLDNFLRISLWMDPITKGGFPEGWTVFYWAWWIAYAPMVGLFVARISKGRTIRELVVAQLGWAALGSCVFMAIWGGYAVHIESTSVIDIKSILSDGGIPAAVLAVLKTLPMSGLIIPVFTILCFIFLATTLDSAAYTLASITSKDLAGDEEPAKWNRIFWAMLLAIFSVGLLAVGGLKAVQLSSIVVALPLMPVLVLLCFSLMRWIKEDFGETMTEKVHSVDFSGQEAVPVFVDAEKK